MKTICVHQRGSTLLVSLIILLVLTIVGISSVGNVSLNQKMATNYRDSDLAFQAAEAALAEGEAQIQLLVGEFPVVVEELFEPSCDSSSGLCFRDQCENGRCFTGSFAVGSPCEIDDEATPIHLESDTWTVEGRAAPLTGTAAFSSLSEPPKYIIEFRCFVELDPGNSSSGSTRLSHPDEWTYFFRVTSFARGRTDASRVMLQSTYKVVEE